MDVKDGVDADVAVGQLAAAALCASASEGVTGLVASAGVGRSACGLCWLLRRGWTGRVGDGGHTTNEDMAGVNSWVWWV